MVLLQQYDLKDLFYKFIEVGMFTRKIDEDGLPSGKWIFDGGSLHRHSV